MNEHTFRPLKVDYGYADYLAISTTDDELVMVAAIDLDEHGAEPTPEQVAYARLFAESPALFEALYWLLNLHHDVSKGGRDPETGQQYPVTDGEWEDALAFAMEAIAKVKGETE